MYTKDKTIIRTTILFFFLLFITNASLIDEETEKAVKDDLIKRINGGEASSNWIGGKVRKSYTQDYKKFRPWGKRSNFDGRERYTQDFKKFRPWGKRSNYEVSNVEVKGEYDDVDKRSNEYYQDFKKFRAWGKRSNEDIRSEVRKGYGDLNKVVGEYDSFLK